MKQDSGSNQNAAHGMTTATTFSIASQPLPFGFSSVEGDFGFEDLNINGGDDKDYDIGGKQDDAPVATIATAAEETQAAASQQAESQTWWGEDGYCYYQAPDGWRYWWDSASNEWRPHQYIEPVARNSTTPPASAMQPSPFTYYTPTNIETSRSIYQPAGCGFAKLVFGGRLLTVSTSGSIKIHAMSSLCPDVLRPVGSGGSVVSLKAHHEMLTGFPSPMGASLDRARVKAFIEARKERCVAEEAYGDASGTHLLWSVLDKLVLDDRPGIPNVLLEWNPASFRARDGVAEVQELMMHGKTTEAVERAIASRLWPLAFMIAHGTSEGDIPVEYQRVVEAYIGQEMDMHCPLARYLLITNKVQLQKSLSMETSSWNEYAAILVANRSSRSADSLLQPGKHLLGQNNIEHAHVCFLLAGAPLSTSQEFAVVGGSSLIQPRTYASLPAIIRTELYTWSKNSTGNAAALLPYKLVHAAILADAGMINQAANYCQSVLTALQTMEKSGQIPPGLVVCRAGAASLNERLQQYAAIHRITLQGPGQNIVSGALKLLDRGISKLMGDGIGQQAMHSRSSSSFSGAGGASIASSPPQRAAMHHRTPSIESNKPLISSLMSKVESFGKNRVGKGEAAPGSSTTPNEPENLFYYDNDLKIWRERGKEGLENPSKSASLAPPPMISSAAPVGVAVGSGVGRYSPPVVGGFTGAPSGGTFAVSTAGASNATSGAQRHLFSPAPQF